MKAEEFDKKLHELSSFENIERIHQKLASISRKCWISGGAVRDVLLGRQPVDVDLTTDASDEEILKLFPHAVLVGRQFGVYKIPFKDEIIDLTVFREEEGYADKRRPDWIKPSSPDKDALRRDFTINALYWDLENKKLVDYVNGVQDLEKGLLKCVGEPTVRFNEDALRIVRTARFAAQLGFKIESETRAAAAQLVSLVSSLSGERIFAETAKVAAAGVAAVRSFWSDSITISSFEEFGLAYQPQKMKDLNLSSPETFEGLSSEDLQLAILFFLMGISEENGDLISKSLKISKKSRHFLKSVFELHQVLAQSDDAEVELKFLAGESEVNQQALLFLMCEANLDSHLINRVYLYQQNVPENLIKAQDILSLVDRHKVSAALKSVKKQQIKGLISTPEEALFYVKNTFSK